MADPYAPFGFMPPMLGPQRQQPMPPPDLQSILDLLGGQPLSMGAQPMPEEAADLQQQGQGMVNAAGIAAPFALGGPMAVGARGLASLARMFPMTTTAAAGGGALVGESTAAGPPQKPAQQKVPNPQKPAAKPAAPEGGADPQLQRLLDSDAVLRGLQKQIDAQEAIANAPAGNDPASGTYPKSSRDGARSRAADLQKEYNSRLMELSRANLPFDQAYPWLAQNRGLVGFLAPAGTGVATRTAGNLLSRVGPARWERALSRADRALERGDDRAYEHFMSRAARFEPRPQSTMSRIGHATAPGIAGGTVGAELSLLPYQHNLTNAPLGSPQRAEAEKMTEMGNMLPRAAFGFGLGALGGATGGHMPNIGPGFRPPPGSGVQLPPTPLQPTGGPTTGALPPPPAGTATALPQPPMPPAPPGPAPISPGTGGIWPAPPSPVPGPQPGLATLGGGRPQPAAPEAPPPVPSQVGSPPKPFPEGAYQDASGRWRIGNRWIADPSK